MSNRIPQFITQSQTIYARKGDKIVLECMVDNLREYRHVLLVFKVKIYNYNLLMLYRLVQITDCVLR